MIFRYVIKIDISFIYVARAHTFLLSLILFNVNKHGSGLASENI